METEENSPKNQEVVLTSEPKSSQAQASQKLISQKLTSLRNALKTRRWDKRWDKLLWAIAFGLAVVVPFQIGWQVVARSNHSAKLSSNSEVANIPIGDRIPVKTVRARTAAVVDLVSGNGSVAAARLVYLNFKTSGIVKFLGQKDGRDLRLGDMVGQGEVLAKVDDIQAISDLTQAETAKNTAAKNLAASIDRLAQSQAILSQAENKLAEAKSRLAIAESDRLTAKLALERYATSKTGDNGTVDTNYVTKRNQLEKSEGSVEIAKSDVGGAEVSISQAREKVAANQSEVDVAKNDSREAIASYDAANTNLKGTSIEAPISGMIADLKIKQGNYWNLQSPDVRSGVRTEADVAAISIADPEQVEVTIELAASNTNRVQTGQTVYIFLDATTNSTAIRDLADESAIALATAIGEVVNISPANNQTQKVKIRVTSGATKIRIGTSVSAWVAVAANPKAVVLPSNSIAYRNQQPYVFVVDKRGLVEQRLVKLGIKGLTNQEIISGVSASELVIIDPKDNITSGTPTEVTDISDIGSFIKQTTPAQN